MTEHSDSESSPSGGALDANARDGGSRKLPGSVSPTDAEKAKAMHATNASYDEEDSEVLFDTY